MPYLTLAKYIGIALLLAAIYGAGYHQANAKWKLREDDAAKVLAELQRKADEETGRLKGRAEAAEHTHDQELIDLRQYRADHPLHGRLSNLCHRPAVSSPTASVSLDGGASPAARDFLAMPEGDSGGSDQLHLLDVLAGKADGVSAQLREWQSR